MKQRIRNPLKILIITVIMIVLSTTLVFASPIYNGSTIKGTKTCGSGTFIEKCSGYRMYICNTKGEIVSNIVDIRLSNPDNYHQSEYNGCRTNTWFVCESTKNDSLYYTDGQGFGTVNISTIHVSQISDLKGTMPKPIDSIPYGDGYKLIPKGGELKTFLKKNKNANLIAILDSKGAKTNKFRFRFTDGRSLALTKPTKEHPKGVLSVAETVSRDGGYVMIEPVFWCVPQGSDATRYNFVFYGTPTNYSQLDRVLDLKDSNNGGWLRKIFGQYGLTTLHIGLNDKTIKEKGMKVYKVPQRIGDLYCPTKGYIERKYVTHWYKGGRPGYALHYVVIDAKNPKERTHTYDNIPNKPHPAPKISNKKINKDKKENGDDPEKLIFQYRIIKVYEEQDKEGTRTHSI